MALSEAMQLLLKTFWSAALSRRFHATVLTVTALAG
jgi:hypothetical protein